MYVPDEIRKSVVFLSIIKGGQSIPVGTAFFVSIEAGNFNRRFVYLVTAKHVIVEAEARCTDHSIWLRINLPKEDSVNIQCPIDLWHYSDEDTSIDAAVLEWHEQPMELDFISIAHTMAVTDEVITNEQIGLGDEVFLTGLFVNHRGKKRNLPIVRVGNIALMPDEKIATKDFGSVDAYLIEARSIGGLSGSPAFVHVGGVRMIQGQVRLVTNRFYWLGLVHGHWNMLIPRQDNNDIALDTLQDETLNMGIAIVVPAIKIMEVINKQVLLERRNKELRRLENEMLTKNDN